MAFTDEALGLTAEERARLKKEREAAAMVAPLTGSTTVAPISPVTAPAAIPGEEDPTKKNKEETRAKVFEGLNQTADPERKEISRLVYPALQLDKSGIDVAGQFNLLSERMKGISDKIPEAKSTEIKNKFNTLNTQLEQVRSNAEKAKEAATTDAERKEAMTGYAEAAEIIGHALAQLGAGFYGLKSGVDLSGVKFQRGDWASKYNQLQDKLKTKLSQIEKGQALEEATIGEQRAEVRDEQKTEERRAVDAAQEQKSLLMNELKSSIDELQRRKDTKNKEALNNFESKMKQADREQQKIDQMDIEDKRFKRDVQLKLMDTQTQLTKAAIQAAKAGDKAAIQREEEKAKALEEGIAALYSLPDMDKGQRDSTLAKVRDKLSKVIPAGEVEKIIDTSKSTSFLWFGGNIQPEVAEPAIREAAKANKPSTTAVQSTSTPAIPTPPPSDAKGRVDLIASKNPGVSRQDIINQLKTANRIPADYAE